MAGEHTDTYKHTHAKMIIGKILEKVQNRLNFRLKFRLKKHSLFTYFY